MIEKQIQEFAEKDIYFNAIKITKSTQIMFDILNKSYKEKMGKDI